MIRSRRLPGLGVGEILLLHGLAPSAIDQVIETGPGNVLVLQKVENGRKLLVVAAVDGKAQADPHALLLAVADSRQGCLESALAGRGSGR